MFLEECGVSELQNLTCHIGQNYFRLGTLPRAQVDLLDSGSFLLLVAHLLQFSPFGPKVLQGYNGLMLAIEPYVESCGLEQWSPTGGRWTTGGL